MHFFLLLLPAIAADWNPKAAADYLDARQAEWFAWPAANSTGKPCLSCHTGLPYLVARPLLRRALGESTASPAETTLLDAARSRAGDIGKESDDAAVEAVLAAVVLSAADARSGRIQPSTPRALDRLWRLQDKDGAWNWYALDLDPWEMPESRYFGASLAALAVGNTPASYQAEPAVKQRIRSLITYLRTGYDSQPLHNRLAALWAATSLPQVLPRDARRRLLKEIAAKQAPGGSWTIESLGPFAAHAKAPSSPGSNAYATAFTAFVLAQAGEKGAALKRARVWLAKHQDPKTGAWPAVSMNKTYEPGSHQAKFMRDAATGYAAAALLQR